MNTARPKPAAEINLEEFERRLRAAAAPKAGVEDPLAELTRLVDTINLDRTPSERALEATRSPKLAFPAPPPPVAATAAPPPKAAPAKAAPVKVTPVAPPPKAAAPVVATPVAPPSEPPSAEFVAPPTAPLAPPKAEAARFENGGIPPLRMTFDEDEEPAFTPPPPARPQAIDPLIVPSVAPRPRGRHWSLKVGGLVAASIAMIAAVAVFKMGARSHSGAPPLILASTAPTKVAPPSEETVRTANENGSLLTRDTAQPTATPPKLTAPAEAPVDLAARPSPSASGEASPVAPASETPIVATASPSPTAAAPVGVDPSRVKTISVRPDGTLISSSYEANAAKAPPPSPAPTPTPTHLASADGEAATPAPALPTKLSPPKNSTRIVAKTDTTAPADSGAGPGPVKPKKPKPSPTPTVAAETETKTDDAADPAVGSAGFSVQFAAPRTQSDADGLMKSLPGRFGDALGGTSLAVRKAERNGEAIYRVRTVGLSRADAKALCVKVKSAGGDCFVAKN